MVSGWFKGITFIVNIICIIIMSAPPQIKRHQIPEVGDPWGLPWGAAMTSHSSFWMATAGLEPATSRPPDFLIIILSLPVQRTWNVTSLWVSPCLLYMFTCSDSKLPKWWKDSLPLSLNFYSLEEYCCSVAKTCLILCDPMDHSMPGFPCPSPSPGLCSNSCPLSQWFHPIISCSVIPFSSCLQSFPASESFPICSIKM